MKLAGTKFQLEVWNHIKKISKGKTVFYKYITKRIGKLNAYRTVAYTCSKISFPIKVPYHRVIKENVRIGAYFRKNNSVIKRIILKKRIYEMNF